MGEFAKVEPTGRILIPNALPWTYEGKKKKLDRDNLKERTRIRQVSLHNPLGFLKEVPREERAEEEARKQPDYLKNSNHFLGVVSRDYSIFPVEFELNMAGSFIVFEGPDGSGTTRQSQFLAERMHSEGYDVLLTSEPTSGSIGQYIRGLLHSETMPPASAVQLLFAADRAEHVQEIIAPALENGQIVISDRFALSTFLYGKAQGLDEQWLRDLNRTFPVPDLTIVTLPPLEVCLERLGKRDNPDQFENTLFQKRIYEEYRTLEDPTAIFIDTSGDRNEVAGLIWRKVQEHFGPISRENIAKL